MGWISSSLGQVVVRSTEQWSRINFIACSTVPTSRKGGFTTFATPARPFSLPKESLRESSWTSSATRRLPSR
jgi:hypothetical protein